MSPARDVAHQPGPSMVRQRIADAAGLGLIFFVLLDYLRPSLLLIPTVAAGGDTPCHYPTFAYFHEHLLPQGRLHGWYPGAYLGHPLLLYYFPLPFLVMSAFAPLVGMPAAFKLGTAVGVFLLPPLAYVAFRLMGFRFPAPLLGASSSLVFLFLEENPIWGGTIASTLTGEFSYTYGTGLAVLFLGLVYRVYARGGSVRVPAAVLAVTGLAHGYAVLWAGLSASFFLFGSRRPWRTLRWLAALAGLAFALAGLWVLPLLADWGWTTPYDDPWITATWRNLAPPLLWPLFGLALFGLVIALVGARHGGGADRRLLFLLYAAALATGLALASPALGIIDVRFVPFAHLAVCLLGGASLGLLLEHMVLADAAALGVVLLGVVHADHRSQVLRHWIDYNYTGLEAKEQWPAFRELADLLKGSVADPRVAVEYSPEHEKAGSIRMYETLPFFSGRSTLEGVYNQASLQTHPVYYLASELGERSPNPFRSIDYARFDPEAALPHLRLFGVREVVALSARLTTALEVLPDVSLVARIPPYAVFRLQGDGRYVEPLAFAPVRSAPSGWRRKALRWFSRQPPSAAHLVFTDDPRFPAAEDDEWLAPPAVPLEPGVEVKETVDREEVRVQVNRVGHPLLVKVSYHPRWKAEGADGPYLVSPALMLIVPRQPEVRLFYAQTGADGLGRALTALGLLVLVWPRRLLRRRAVPVPWPAAVPALDACGALPPEPRRWGGLIPGALLVLLVAARLFARTSDRSAQAADLLARASRAYSAERFADAAEYARGALTCRPPAVLQTEILSLRGESLLRDARPTEAAEAFDAAILLGGPHTAQSLFGSYRAHSATGDQARALAARTRLLDEFPETPWAERVLAAGMNHKDTKDTKDGRE